MREKEPAVTFPESSSVPPELLALAESTAAPQLTDRALDYRFGRRSTWIPAAGQLWRAVREDVTALVLLLAVHAETVTAAPVTFEASEADADTLGLDGTALGVPITVWIDLRRLLPLSVLDRPVDDLGVDVVHRAVQQSDDGGGTPDSELAAADVRAELEDDLAILAEAPTGIAPAPAPAEAEAVAGIDLDALDPAALDEAAARLAVPLPVLLDLIDGKRPPTPAEAEVLQEVLGAAPTANPPPVALVVELAQPRWRGLVRQHRRRGHPTEDTARRAVAYEVAAVAARQTGGQEPSWPDRIRRWAQAHQLDPDADA
jgi:hypothetical protein